MRNKIGLLVAVLFAVVSLAACGGGGGGGGGAVPQGGGTPSTPPSWAGAPILKSSLTASPILSFRQSVASNDHAGPWDEIFPGQANVWILEPDFTVVDGFDLQFGFSGALAMTISSGGSSTMFPVDQAYSELAFYTPLMGAADGVKVAAVSDGNTVLSSLPSSTSVRSVITGSYAAFLNATSASKLQQTLDLTSLPTGTTIRLTWNDAAFLFPSDLDIDVAPTYSVILYKDDGTSQRIYGPVTQTGVNGVPFFGHSILLNANAGHSVVLSFEIESSTLQVFKTPGAVGESYAIIDQVSVKNVNNVEIPGVVTNGGFETNSLTGWTTNTPSVVQNVTSGTRAIGGLNVKRSFYTAPNKLWARWVDVFENPSGAPITRTISYTTELGSNGYGVIYNPDHISSGGTTSRPQALTSWDATRLVMAGPMDGTRDIGLVFGNVDADPVFTTEDGSGGVGVPVGDPFISYSYNITVPAGGKVALVNFALMSGTDTGQAALTFDPLSDDTARATDIDTEAMNILTHFWDDPDHQYLRGMTEAQIAVIKNFTH